MAMIEGVGDEVVQFVGVLLVTVVGLCAWWSTNARPGRYRTVVVMRPRQHHPVTVSFRSRPNFMITNNQATNTTTNTEQEITPETVAVSTTEAVDGADSSDVIPLQEMDSIIDADMAMMNNNRLHFYRRIDGPEAASSGEPARPETETQEPEPASNEQIREMDSIVSAMEADVTSGCDVFARPNETTTSDASSRPEVKNDDSEASTASANSSNEPTEGSSEGPATGNSSGDDTKILIKLKYLNDTLREVEGDLDELLKDFTWRHFAAELSSEARVRLVHGGRVLPPAATLRAAGLHHRAVVHALVHPARTAQQTTEETTTGTTQETAREGAAHDRVWDFENILMTLVSVALTVVWFFRCEYSNMFTASASVALFGLTVFYSVAIFGLYLSDTFHSERRGTQPQAMF